MWRIANSDNNWFFGIGAYLMRCGDAVSQLVNVLIFFSKNPNESLSGRSYREKHHWFWGKMLILIDGLFYLVQKDHCQKAHEADVARASALLKSAV
jgi:hypothetical protein